MFDASGSSSEVSPLARLRWESVTNTACDRSASLSSASCSAPRPAGPAGPGTRALGEELSARPHRDNHCPQPFANGVGFVTQDVDAGHVSFALDAAVMVSTGIVPPGYGIGQARLRNLRSSRVDSSPAGAPPESARERGPPQESEPSSRSSRQERNNPSTQSRAPVAACFAQQCDAASSGSASKPTI